jgi:putative ABC transport system permease protein
VSVQQRRRQFALLNAVGVSRRTLLLLCLVETGFLALTGAGLGVLAGRALALATTGLVGVAASEIWVQLDVHERMHSWTGTGVGMGIGLLMAVVAAYLAVRTTFTASTVEALRPGGVAFERTPRRLPATVIAALLLGATWTITVVSPHHAWLVIGVIIVSELIAYIGAAVLSPTLVASMADLLRRVTVHSYRLPVRLAVENMPRAPRRSGMTVTVIAAAIGMTVGLAGLVQSFEGAWLGWIDHHFGADLFVGSGARFRLLAGPPMDASVRATLAGVEGVASVEPFRVIPMRLGGRPVFLQGVSIDDRLAHGGLAMVEGDLAAAAPALRDGTGVLLSDNLAFRLGRHRGDRLTLPTPAGERTYRIEGTFVDYLGSLDRGSVAVSTDHLATAWDDRAANLFRVWLAGGADPSRLRRAVLQRLGPGYYVVTSRQFVDAVRSALQSFFLATWGLVVLAALVSVIGVVNAQLATVIDRGPEISMLRTIGVSARDVTRGVILECGVLGLIGALLGLAPGSMRSGQFVVVSMRLLTGWRLPFSLPVLPLLGAASLAVLVSSLAGWVPARAAARVQARQQSPD